MCHYQHRAHGKALYLPGEQDITAHVDFGAIIQSARVAGLEPLGCTNQASFLLGAGLLQRIPMDVPVQEQLELAQQVKKLTLPHEMGELFKVLALARNCSPELSGFAELNLLIRLEATEPA